MEPDFPSLIIPLANMRGISTWQVFLQIGESLNWTENLIYIHYEKWLLENKITHNLIIGYLESCLPELDFYYVPPVTWDCCGCEPMKKDFFHLILAIVCKIVGVFFRKLR